MSKVHLVERCNVIESLKASTEVSILSRLSIHKQRYLDYEHREEYEDRDMFKEAFAAKP